ncbi:rRNA biogenesis protein RRP5 [Abrus precatorius]|uniref:rRNA biogenesis protein RRP5 n=1 Tax=Abrus precatorius TaxID=3816 RepID=A0A8B8M8V8_ABRPR|nr:rRNA biogenesis protein RRP5 [Abrus precatorius]
MAPHSKKPHKKKVSGDKPKINKASKKIFKPKREQNDAVAAAKSETLALQLEDDVPDFPRGGEFSVKRRNDDDEFGAEDHSRKTKKNWKKGKTTFSKSNEPADDLGLLSGDRITGKLPRRVNRITLKNITPGMKLWGVVAEVNEKDLVVSLPGGLRGLVHASDALDPIFDNKVEVAESFLSGVFCVGQLVSCVVLRLDDDKKEKGSRKIWLSLRLSLLHKNYNLDVVQEGMVLAAYVKSIEDHGYILHFGLSSFTGFLPKNSSAESWGGEVKMGKLMQGLVRSIDKVRRVVYLSSDPGTMSKSVTKDLRGMSIDLLVPGMMVNARVKSILENGVMLSFLTYFTGTVDLCHLHNIYPGNNWKDKYSEAQKVFSRILFIDPSSRAVGLTLNPHLIQNRAPPSYVKIGDIYDNSRVVRVDKGSGLLLEVPSIPEPTPAFVSISDIAEEIQKLEKKYKEGNHVRVRILGLRHLEGIATGVLKASAFEEAVFTHSDVKPGMVVKAKILSVDSFGAIVQIPGGVKALCPLPHMSELEMSKPGKKFKVGAELVFRVLGCKSKRVTVTHKKTLVKSKLGIISSYADATDGLITHGWITKIEVHGCFVRFYNGVQGFAPRSELGLEPGADPGTVYHVGQVVKCRVTSSIPASRRINLSFVIKPTRVTEGDMVTLGSLVSGVVDRIASNAVVVCVNASGFSRGTISEEHLADHHGQAILMKSVLKPGYNFDQLLVLDVKGNNLVLSAKSSLIKYAQQIPANISQIQPNSVVHGYICNLIETGCFVRFLGHLTGFAPRNKAADDQKTNILEAYYVGQSVRSNVSNISSETGRVTLSLKQTACSSTDASFIQDYFYMDEKIAKLQCLGSDGSDLKWDEGFNIGTVARGKVEDVKDVGLVISFEKCNDIFGFITNYQLAGTIVERGSVVEALVLDVAKAERLVDLSLKPEFINRSKERNSISRTNKKKRQREASKDLVLHQMVNAVVEIVKENYLVVSIPDNDSTIGYASVSDYNTQRLPHKQFLNGQSVVATVMALPSPETSGRLLLLLNEVNTSSSKRTKKSSYKVGSLVEAEITDIKSLEMKLKFGFGIHGRVHITEVHDAKVLENPFSGYKIGLKVTAKIVAKPNESDGNRKGSRWELTVRPEMIAGSSDKGDVSENLDFKIGQYVAGYVYKVESEWVWLTISQNVRAQLYILDSSVEPHELENFQNRYHVGQPVSGHVLSINQEKQLLRLVLHPFSALPCRTSEEPQINSVEKDLTAYVHEGDILGGRVSKVLPGVGGLLVQIGPHAYGRVHFTELSDTWVPDPLSGYHEGQFVKCVVLEVSHTVKGTIHVDLSLRSSNIMLSQNSADHLDKFVSNAKGKCVEKIDDLHPDMIVKGYVKNVTPKGCFIFLSRKIDAKILLSNLSDNYVKDPEKEFPVGKLVIGRVKSVESLSNRVEVTLKTSAISNRPKSEIIDLTKFHVGDVISGKIKRVESFGLFIAIDNTNMVGLCHVSEISDNHIENIEAKYRAGERVNAKVLKVDEERHRISLGMKNSYMRDEAVLQTPSKEGSDEPIADGMKSLTFINSSFLGSSNIDVEDEIDQFPILSQAQQRADVPPLDVALDDFDQFNVNHTISQSEEHAKEEDTINEKHKRHEKKKAKEEREKQIRAAEERLLEEDVPRTADEFEKLVRRSPNSSFIWIKYMNFMISMADIEKARSIAERALRTINIREENEKLNIWKAYFNLENKYGNPREEAVMKVFQRALQYNDPKKVYLALLAMYERTEQHDLADELLNKMTKKFKHSCKVWLRRVQNLLKKKQDGVQPLVNRALLSLPRHKHIKFISQTAIHEFKAGVPDRGRSLFEGILREYPKRTDLWSVYLDQEIQLKDEDIIRALFERAISLSLPPKRMKFLFKKYLDYEKSHGDEDRIESVKRKAMEYVESSMA